MVESLPNFPDISRDSSGVADGLISLARNGATHVSRPGSGEETPIVQIKDVLLPALDSLGLRVDVLEVLRIDLVDAVGNPAALYLNRRRPVAEQSGAMRTVDVEHVRVTADGGAKIGLGTVHPFLIELGVVDALETELGHD